MSYNIRNKKTGEIVEKSSYLLIASISNSVFHVERIPEKGDKIIFMDDLEVVFDEPEIADKESNEKLSKSLNEYKKECIDLERINNKLQQSCRNYMAEIDKMNNDRINGMMSRVAEKLVNKIDSPEEMRAIAKQKTIQELEIENINLKEELSVSHVQNFAVRKSYSSIIEELRKENTLRGRKIFESQKVISGLKKTITDYKLKLKIPVGIEDLKNMEMSGEIGKNFRENYPKYLKGFKFEVPKDVEKINENSILRGQKEILDNENKKLNIIIDSLKSEIEQYKRINKNNTVQVEEFPNVIGKDLLSSDESIKEGRKILEKLNNMNTVYSENQDLKNRNETQKQTINELIEGVQKLRNENKINAIKKQVIFKLNQSKIKLH